MIKNYNNTDLVTKGVDPKLFLFCQLWKELTHRRTLDTYQFMVLNTISLIKELIILLEQKSPNFGVNYKSIEACKNETSAAVKRDMILQESFHALRGNLLWHLNEKTEKESQQRILMYHLQNALRIIEPVYLELLFSSIEKSIDIQDFVGIKWKVSAIISCCADKGWSTCALHDSIRYLYGSHGNSDKWENFKNKFLKDKQDEYKILMPLKNRVITALRHSNPNQMEDVMKEIEELGIKILGQDEVTKLESISHIVFKRDTYYLSISTKAHDYYSASYAAISIIANVLDLLSFYRLIEPWNIRDIRWIVVNSSNLKHKHLSSNDLFIAYEYLDKGNKIFDNSKILYKETSNDLTSKLRATYAYANMGKASYTQEEKFMNTWVALESLCRTDLYETIIDNILGTVPPALCLRYMYRLIYNFAEDCVRCNVSFQFSENPIDLLDLSKGNIVNSLLTAFQDERMYQEMLISCSVNELLVERCKELHIIAINDNKLFEDIEYYYQSIKWQLSRLYRIRNEIAHSALNDGSYLIRYIERLNDYLNIFVAEIILMWKSNRQSSIEGIFELINDNYQVYLNIRYSKKNANSAYLLEPIRKSGVISLLK